MPFPRPVRRAVFVAAYGVLFFLFDTLATHFEVRPGVSIWYPSAGLNLALLVILGARYAPVVFVASFLSGFWIADPVIPAHHLVLPGLVITLSNAGAAYWLRRSFSPRHPFDLKGGGRFVVVAFLLPVVIAIGAVSSYTLTGFAGYTAQTVLNVAATWWIGDAVGILTITPLALLVASVVTGRPTLGEGSREQMRFFLRTTRGQVSAVGDVLLLAAALYGSFFATADPQFQFYVCFLPLLWIALRNGLPRTLVAVLVVNAGATIAIHVRGTPADLVDVQLFMIALALTGLLLGMLVSERRRAVFILERASRSLEQRLRVLSTTHPASGNDRPPEASFFGDGDRVDPDRIDTIREASSGEGKLGSGTRWSQSSGGKGSPLSIRGVNDILASSSDVLSRSAQNLVLLNQLMLESKDRLSASNAQKDKLLSLISHDLKNPLVGIRGLAELMASQDPPEPFERPLMLIQRSSEQALDLLDNLLTWSRLQTGHFQPDPQLHRLRSLTEEAIAQLETQAARKGVSLQNDVDTQPAVYTDAFIVDTVLRNLISNAVKFTERGGTVRIDAETRADDVVVSVADDGVGMSDALQNDVFDMAAPTSEAGTEGESGTGLGLHICSELVEVQGGKIWVESEPGAGTTFSFTLAPARRALEA